MTASGDGTKQSSGVADTLPATEPGDGPREHSTIPDDLHVRGEREPPAERYQLGAELGRGGMGRVVEAFDGQLGRTVALKEVLPHRGTSVDARFEREVRITARLEHPAIVPLYDAGHTADGRPYYVMRKVTGRPLDQLIARATALPERLALVPNLLAAFDAIAHAHKRHVLHRDLKPANILVGENGETVVIDWGLAKVVGETEPDPPSDVAARTGDRPSEAGIETQVGTVFGTPGFMPPEQARGDGSTERGDVFALGATLYHLLAGRPPIAGSGPTEAIESAIQRRIVPIAEAAPAAPPELHAIVEKALAYEPGDRYANAEALADDLRRFSTGQLVAAHSYTPRERLARFVRHNRAPLSVAALALAAGAVLAWIGVHRILVERDLATAAQGDAERARTAAVALAAKERDHADALVIAQARSTLDANPTLALAMLTELGADSPRSADARGVAVSAVARGVARAYPADGTPLSLDLDRGGRRLAETTAQGTVRVWDLDAHRVSYEHAFRGTAHWLGTGRLLLTDDAAARVLDVATGRIDALDVGAVRGPALDGAGMHVAFIDATGTPKLLDAATGVVTPLPWPGHTARDVLLSPDAAALAVADDKGLAVIDTATGKVAFAQSGQIVLTDAAAGRFAGLDEGHPIELVRAAAWSIVRRDGTGLWASYRDDGTLDVLGPDGIAHVAGGRTGHLAVRMSSFGIAHAARGITVVPGENGRLAYFTDELSGTLVLPAALTDLRLAARRDQTRLAVAGDGLVLVYELADVVPEIVPKDGVFQAAFADRDTLLLWPGNSFDGFTWWNLAKHTGTRFEPELFPLAQAIDADPSDGRLLIADPQGGLSIAQAGQGAVQRVLAGGSSLFGVLAPGGALVADGTTSRVLFVAPGAPPRELAKVAGRVAYVQLLDRRRFAALGNAGELVRGELAGGDLERIHVAAAPGTVLGRTTDGDVVIGTGTALQVWAAGGAPRPLATLPRAIGGVAPSGDGVLVWLDGRSVYYVAPGGAAREVLPASSFPAVTGDRGSWVARAGNGQIDLVEIPSLARWSLPQLVAPNGDLLPSPRGRRIAVPGFGGYAIYDLAQPGSDLAAWIEDHTNAATSPDGALVWR